MCEECGLYKETKKVKFKGILPSILVEMIVGDDLAERENVMKEDRGIPISHNNQLYFIDEDLANFGRKHQERLQGYEDLKRTN